MGGRLETRFQGCCGRKTRAISSMTKLRARMPAQMLALDRAASAQHRTSNANSLGGQNSAGFPQICATYRGRNEWQGHEPVEREPGKHRGPKCPASNRGRVPSMMEFTVSD